eukprot:TRINITY_DN10384_c0_g2_i1.p1 TRINITY_DN10384_c0_g2~~TRINITY_DN10384_c0_g2_i1.p1  ORF type:complete len:979 (-),score=126.63 TRINITY_DN10384_c0_g2_i1:26-2587(-)
MYASITAQSYGTRMLTQFVRLPIASQAHIARAAAAGADYEKRSLAAQLRVPFLPSGSYGFYDNDSAGSSSSDSETLIGLPSDGTFITATQAEELTKMPAAMLDHIRFYRKMQLNWQAYDAYARVCLFAGVNSLLYCCMYWSLGSFLKGQRAAVAAFGVALIFSSIQVVLTKLDLGLDRPQVIKISALLATTPVITTAGMLLFQMIDDNHSVRWHLSWQRIAMRVCAVSAHALHTVVATLMLRAATPHETTNQDDHAQLPSAFHSTLFLDVFGWLLNRGGPGLGPRGRAAGGDEDDTVSEVTALDGASDPGSPTSPRGFSAPTSPTRQRSRAGSGMSNPTSLRDASSPGRQQSVEDAASDSRSHRSMLTTRSNTESTFSSRSARGSRPGLGRRLRNFGGELVESFVGSTDSDRSRRRREAPRIDVYRDLEPHARSLFHGGSTQVFEGSSQAASSSHVARPHIERVQEDTQQTRYGGEHSVNRQAFHSLNDTSAEGSAYFVSAGSDRVGRPQYISGGVEIPLEQPWTAFRRGTKIIIVLWAMSTVWSIYKAAIDLMNTGNNHDSSASVAALQLQPLPLNSGHFLLGPLCNQGLTSGAALQQEQQDMSRQLRRLLSHRASTDYVLLDTGCGVHTAPLDVSADCRASPGLPGRQCYVAVLQRGGHTVSLCNLWQHGRVLRLRPLARMRLVAGLPALRSLAVHRQEDQPDLTGLQIFGRAGGALLALRVQPGARGDSLHGSKLMPAFEVEAPVQGEVSATPSMDNERLLVSAGALFSLRPMLLREEEIAAGSQLTCSSGFRDGLRLRAWDLATGEQSDHWVPISPNVLGSIRFRSASPHAMGVLQTALCQGTVDKATA